MNASVVVGIGMSSGGLAALRPVVEGLPADLDAAVLIVQHLSAGGATSLVSLLAKWTALPVQLASDGAELRAGIFVAPNDIHLAPDRRWIHLLPGTKVSRARPSIDVLFRNLASHWGERAIGVQLSGSLYDGASGLAAIKRSGGRAIVQDPFDALSPSMPRAAIAQGPVDFVLRAGEMSAVIAQLVADIAATAPPLADDDGTHPVLNEPSSTATVTDDFERQERGERLGTASLFTCPDCGGTMWELADGDALRYRCFIGHEFSEEGIAGAHHQHVQDALWSAVRLLQENAALNRRLEGRFRELALPESTERFRNRAHEADQQAATLRGLIESSLPAIE